MKITIPKSHIGLVVMLGSVWGLSEAALGMGLGACAAHISGSLMTGVAFFFMAASWIITKRILAVALLILIASLFKMFDALLLSLPIQHGAIGNPIFAFLIEGLAFVVILTIVKETLRQKKTGQAILGGASALVAVGLFPLVKFATGIPACVYPGTTIPLSIYFSPFAVALSIFTVPLGFWVGKRFKVRATGFEMTSQIKTLNHLVSPVTLLLCLAVVALIRLI